MKIRAIELSNLRRFAGQRARIEGIGDGISVLSQPNEFGKSTFFDGLHAVFFQPHRSSKAPVKALQPHSGGSPEASVEIELPEGHFRIEKRWLGRANARILDAQGRIIAQEDEAEAWIDRLTGQGLAGPSGLLWVRQGLLGMEPEGNTTAEKAERERALVARRDLISSVAGEIEVMTGGRRMDLVLARVSEELARLATSTLRPKAGGEWARAVDEAAAMAAERAVLEGKVARLSAELRQRASIAKDLASLADPEASARDEAALAAAETALQAAEKHSEALQKAEAELRLAQLTAKQGQDAILRLEGVRTRLQRAQELDGKARDEAAKAEALAQAAAQQEASAVAGADTARAAALATATRLEAAQRAQLAIAARDRVAALEAELARAERQRGALEEQQAARQLIKISKAQLEAAEAAQSARDRLALQDEARRVSVSLRYDSAARVTVEGLALGDAPLRLRGLTHFDLPGIGQMSVDPGLSGAGDMAGELAKAEAKLAQLLSACGCADLAAARSAWSEAQRLDTALAEGRARLAELAPEGVEALQSRLAAARAEAGEATEVVVEDLPALQGQLTKLRQAEDQAQAVRREAEARHATLRETRAARQAELQSAGQALAAIQSEAGDPVELSAQLLNLKAAQPGLEAAQVKVSEILNDLKAKAPDLATAHAAVTRLRSVVAGRQRDRIRLESELAGVNGSIGALADEGIEESLDELRGREAAALARAARYEREVQALKRLREALERARQAMRDEYFGEVLQELNPLLSILHPGAALRIDDASLLPVALSRDGQDEVLDILSGGTREQLAVLTRLAFARLFARSGRPVPVILDDALVHSDDDRIEAMFTALHRVAQDQQIIVLTCRQRAFAPLGGDRLLAKVTAL
ncbi:chromosome segregation protein SMC [Xinfangfangia sp. CPCC 101601]|uniref:Chromosome segregation protein SMC n=1 Tax=Pseudogemmobacter lacusdianii TaxID=3069608 RepID=A0ABU0W0L0_9RHOB|nr:chromosome segregation protein SMC [Xinfangfangia sp. CPCC 101601]MDQ2067533.1 chromosome segregation protein SMC [Xinfangfangia sp. CPCC 101601]